ncbi:MAG: AAA family ATPase, partial [Acidimicrobiales bacterium]
MLCPVLVGRSEQLRLLAAVVADARDQRGTWVTVAGEAGVGKTRLVAEAVDRSGSGGTPVLMGRCSAVDRSTPYRPLAECLIAAVRARPRPDSDPAIVPYVPVVARFVPHWRHETSPATVESPAVVGESLLRVLGWLNEGGHALLVLEDLQWADPDTLAVCDYLIDHLGSTSLAVIATVRSVGTTADVSMMLRRTPHVQLGPLTDEEVLELATACLGRSPSRETMAHLHHTAGGLPLLVEDLLDDPGSSA